MRRKLPLSLRILLGLGLGVLAGLALQDAPEFSAAWIQPFGTLFLNLVKMLVVPLVFCSLTAGVGGLGDARHMGRVGGRTLLFYLCTTALAVALGLLSANLFPVGRGLGYPLPAAREEAPSFSLADTLLGIVPTNPIQALAEGNMLQILFFALALGWAALTIGEKGAPLLRAFGSLAEAMYALTERTMVLAPVAVFALIAPVVAAEGPRVLSSLLGVAVLVYGACLVQLLLVYGGAVGALARRSPRRFFREALPAVVSMLFIDETSGGYIDLVGETYFGITRRPGWRPPSAWASPPGCAPSSSPWVPPSTWTAPPSTRGCAPCSSPMPTVSPWRSPSSSPSSSPAPWPPSEPPEYPAQGPSCWAWCSSPWACRWRGWHWSWASTGCWTWRAPPST